MAETGKASGRWLRVALVVSLGLNLAVAGLVLGAVLKDGPPKRGHDDRNPDRVRYEQPPPALRELGPLPFIVALSPDDRAAILDAARKHSDDLKESRETLRNRFEEMLRVLRSEPFDRDAMEALLAEQRAVGAARQEVGEALLVGQFEAMGPDGRAAYADRLDKSLKRSPARR